MAERPSRLPLILLGLSSVLAFGGPFVIWLVVRGGDRAAWPPDRQVEWLVLFLVVGLFAALLVACVGLAALQLRRGRDEATGALDANDLHLTDADAPATDVAGPNDLQIDRPGHPSDANDLRL